MPELSVEPEPFDYMSMENSTQDVCGFTSALCAVYQHRPRLRHRLLTLHSNEAWRNRHLRAEIKTFLMVMKAEGNLLILRDITMLTRILLKSPQWNVESFITYLNKTAELPTLPHKALGITMPQAAVMVYLRRIWGMRSFLVPLKWPGDAILGLSEIGARKNIWNNITHYVYQDANGRIYSWGKQYEDFSELNYFSKSTYFPVYRIALHG